MKKIMFLNICSIFFCVGAIAQQKSLEIDMLVGSALAPAAYAQIGFIGKETALIVDKDNKASIQNVKTGKQEFPEFFTKINTALKKMSFSELEQIPAFSRASKDNVVYFFHENNNFKYDFKKDILESLSAIPAKATAITMGNSSDNFTFCVDNNLYLVKKSIEIPITQDDDKNIVNGAPVHRFEFGVSKGSFWSPNDNYVAFYRNNQSMVTNYPLIDIAPRIASTKNIKYPMAGMNNEQVKIGIYNLSTAQTIFLETGTEDHFLTSVTWSADEKYVYVAILTRSQKKLEINKYETATGKFVTTLFTETNNHWIEPMTGLLFLPTNKDQFLWLSERDGFYHFYLYNTEGKLIRQVTKGNWSVMNFISFSSDGNTVYFMSNKDNPLNNQLYAVNIPTGEVNLISGNDGVHSISYSGSDYFMDEYSNADTAYVCQAINAQGKIMKKYRCDVNPLKDYTIGKTEVFTIKAEDNATDLYCRMIKPYNFDSTKQYPVLIYVYGGPHAQLITNSWLSGAGLFLNYMAQQGYIVFTLDNRGSANRGFDFEKNIFKTAGRVAAIDQMTGVEYLKTLPYVDTLRIGVDGWSFGGFMAITLKLKYPGVFKVATAGGPVIDWQRYEIMYTERYMDSPQINQSGYDDANLLNHVDSLSGKLMLMHGAVDDVVLWQHSLLFVQECIKKNKQVDYFVFPRHPHNVRGIERKYLYRKLYEYYQQNL